MKKIKLFPFMLLPLALTSCGENKYLGTYSFQLGRDSGTHFGVYATMTNKEYTYKDEGGEIFPLTGEKVMKLKLSLGGANIGGILDLLSNQDVSIKAYYSIGKKLSNDQGNVLKFGFNLKEIVDDILPDEEEPEPSPITMRDGEVPVEGEEEDPEIPIPEDLFNILPEQTAKIVYSTISKSSLVFNIPVSMDDLEYQLYWYGLDLEDLEAKPAEHPIGTHPTAEDVTYINEVLNYPATHENKSFRDYHTLSLTLTKK